MTLTVEPVRWSTWVSRQANFAVLSLPFLEVSEEALLRHASDRETTDLRLVTGQEGLSTETGGENPELKTH